MTNNLELKQPLKKVVAERRSNRGYSQKALEPKIIQAIEKTLLEGTSPFGETIRYKIVSLDQKDSQESLKLGTYGIIKGAKHFMLSATEIGPLKMESLGYQMEAAVLQAADMGLGTCWLGGTFNRGQFATAIGLNENETLPIVIPFGYPAEKDGILGSLIRSVAGSNQRKPWEELFFEGALNLNEGLGLPLAKEKSGKYSEALEMVQMAPSASNKQPWRVVKDGKDWHFVLSHTKGYSKGFSYDIQRVDMGIAVCHFDMAVKELGLTGSWKILTPPKNEKRDDLSYIISWCEA